MCPTQHVWNGPSKTKIIFSEKLLVKQNDIKIPVNGRHVFTGKNALFLKMLKKHFYKEISDIISAIVMKERSKYVDKKIYHINSNTLRSVIGPVTKFKNLSDVQSILLDAVENDFQLFIQKESYENASDL